MNRSDSEEEENAPKDSPSTVPSETDAPGSGASLSTKQLLTMMVSMQQSLTNFQLSMAEDKVERKARMDKELELREHMLQIEEMKLKDMELRREQAQRDAEAAATYQEAQTKAQELRQKDLLEEEKKRREQREKEAQAKEEARKQREDARKKDERLKAIPNMVPMTIDRLISWSTSLSLRRHRKRKKDWKSRGPSISYPS